MWVFAAIVTLELFLVHLLVSLFWSHVAAWVLTAMSLATLIWVVLLIRSLKRLPVLVDDDGVTMRVGTLKAVRIPVGSLAGLRTAWPREELQQRGVLNLAMINYPNVMLDLDPPLPGGRHPVRAIAHRLDDPGAFAAAVTRLLEARS
ncbi:MAG TPA: hypothetical protein VMG08_19865 [Allosphingosinicella sp.]|nr:hypothetical protein [Allosphingosinicella sp.]